MSSALKEPTVLWGKWLYNRVNTLECDTVLGVQSQKPGEVFYTRHHLHPRLKG